MILMANFMFILSALISLFMVIAFIPAFNGILTVNAEARDVYHDEGAEKNALFFSLLRHPCFAAEGGKGITFSEEKLSALSTETVLEESCAIPDHQYELVIEDLDAGTTVSLKTGGYNGQGSQIPSFSTPVFILAMDNTLHKGLVNVYV